jgi:biotin synthase-related radical SAM superfamily protein
MKKTFQVHLRIETEAIPHLKKEAEKRNISLAEVCREKLRKGSDLQRIELILERICEKLKINLGEGLN